MTHDPREAWGPVSRVKNLNRQVGSNYPRLIEALGEVLEGGYWREFESGGTGTRIKFERFEDFLDWCNFPPKELIAVLDAHKEQVLLAQVRVELGGDLAEHGEIGNGRESRDRDTNSKKQDDATYIVARLRRDEPELAEKVMAGDLSANAAAIEAGFRRRYIRIPLGDAPAAVGKLLNHYSYAELTRELEALV